MHRHDSGQVMLDFSGVPLLKGDATFREARAFCLELYRAAVQHVLDHPGSPRGDNPHLERIWEIAYRFCDEYPYRKTRQYRPAPVDYFEALTHRHTEGTLTPWTRVSRAPIQAVTPKGEPVSYNATLKMFDIASVAHLELHCPCEGAHSILANDRCEMPGAITPTGYRSVFLGSVGPQLSRANELSFAKTLSEWLQHEVDASSHQRSKPHRGAAKTALEEVEPDLEPEDDWDAEQDGPEPEDVTAFTMRDLAPQQLAVVGLER